MSGSSSRWRDLLAVASGLILASAFPKIGVAGLAWVAPGLILGAGLAGTGRQTFRAGYLAGLAHHLVSLSWLLHIPVFKLAPMAGWLALSGFLALYQAVWVWLCWRLFPRAGTGLDPAPALGGPGDTGGSGNWGDSSGGRGIAGWRRAFEDLLQTDWVRRQSWAFRCAALWVGLEMVQARFLSGFPWNLLGSSQFRMTPILQVSAVTGIYGVSFLAVWFGVSLLLAGVVIVCRAQSPRRWVGEIILPMLVLTGVVVHGYRVILEHAPGARAREQGMAPAARVALVQPSIPQRWIWNPQESSNRFVQLMQLTEKAMVHRPDLVVWPEAAVPGFVQWETNTHQAIVRFVRTNQVWMILGGDDAAPRAPFSDEYDVFNASFLVSPAGEFVARYAKQRLVMFGEYLPFVRWLPFLERWTGMGSFTPGGGPHPFLIPPSGERPRVKTSVLICFEDVFPHGAREFVDDDTDFLLNLTNNGWFGESAAQWQHAAGAVFRAVENGVPLVRCGNNGLTCWVDSVGKIHQLYFDGSDDIYGPGIKLVTLPLLGGARRPATFYRRYGDVFGWGCVAWSGLAAIWSWRRRVSAGTTGGSELMGWRR